MLVYPWLLSALLIGQAGGPTSTVIVHPPTTLPVQAISDGDGTQSTGFSRNSVDLPPTAVPQRYPGGTTNVQARATPDQLVAEVLAQPLRGTTAGQPLTLLAAISPLSDRPRQLEAVHAYWRLVQTAGEYHYFWERQQRLARLTAVPNEAGELRTAQAVAAARLQEAEIRLTAAQHELAAAARLAETAPLPWPADRPLTEGYRTRFDDMFAGRKAPDRARMLDQTLPLRQRAVQSHAAAVLAAEESLDAALELHAGSQGDLAAVVRAIDAVVQQQQEFLAAVCRYNDSIADYALAVVPPQTAADILVTTLIKPIRPARPPAPSGAVPAGYQEPLVAPPRASPPPARVEGPSAIPAIPPAAAPPRSENDPSAPRLAPPQELVIPLAPEEPPSKAKSTDTSVPRSTLKPVVDGAPADGDVRHGAGDLVEQATKLAAALYAIELEGKSPALATVPHAEDAAQRSAKAETVPGAPLQLTDCLRSTAADRRMEAIDAYWAVRQADAYGRLLAEQGRQLDALRPALTAQNPPSPTAMPVLRSAKLTVEARLADAEVDHITAIFQLVLATGLPMEKDLPRPTSVPIAGHFSLSFPAKAVAMQSSWPLRQAEAELPRWEQAIGRQAVAITEADAARSAATADVLAGRAEFNRAIAAIDAYTSEAAAFLQNLSDYNRAIARYTFLRLGPNAGVETVVAALANK